MKRILASFLGLGLAFAGPTHATESNAENVLTFGIVPQQSASRLAVMWGPFLDELGAQTGMTFRFKTTKDIPTFEACMASGQYDVAYMNPMHYTIFSAEVGYRAIARQSEKRLKGVIVTRADSEIQSIGDLNGTQIAFPSPGAFGASILTRSNLSEQGVSFAPNYVKSHDSVYRAVASGLVAAGGGVSRTLGAVDPAIRSALRIIHETRGYTPHAIATHPDLGDELSRRIQSALMDVARERPDLIRDIGMKGFEAGGDADWDDVRALSMPREATGILQAGDVTCPSG
jgi:phosphonate transport system substrate-binding protein